MNSIRSCRRIVAAGFLAGIGSSHVLWYGPARLYPRAPIVAGLPWLELTLTVALAATLVAILVRPSNIASWIAIGLTASLVILDQSRLQPWVFDYCLLLAAMTFGDDALFAAKAIIGATYFWSAIQKMNVVFLTQTWPDVVRNLRPLAVLPVAAVIPLIELAIAIALWTRRWRRIAVRAAIAMHIFNIVVLVASGENSVVWAWNAAMAALTFMLFGVSGAAPVPRPAFRVAVVVVVAGVLPVLSFANLWDAYLSWALYSGDTIQGVVVVDSASGLPALIQRNTWTQSRPNFIDLNRWSYEELNVPAYPAERVLKAIGFAVCRDYSLAGSGEVVILGRANVWTGARRKTAYPCE